MRKTIFLFIAILALSSCNSRKSTEMLFEAERIVDTNKDSALYILSQLPSQSSMLLSEKMDYIWLKAYIHFLQNSSLAEDSCIMKARMFYKSRNDKKKSVWAYRLSGHYLYWIHKAEESIIMLDSAANIAMAQNNITLTSDILSDKASVEVYLKKDFKQGETSIRKALALYKIPENYYSLGIIMGLTENDSADYYINKGIDEALKENDTIHASNFLRNYAQLLVMKKNNPVNAIKQVKRLYNMNITPVQESKGYLILCECFLKINQLDSAQYYLDKASAISNKYPKNLSNENLMSQLQSLIDYTNNRSFNSLNIARYNDSIWNAISEERSTTFSKEQSINLLARENLLLEVEKQHSQLLFLCCIILIMITFSLIIAFILRKRNKLIEKDEKIEALNRLLADASHDEKNGNNSDDNFFKRILLQQLGIIKLMASSPGNHNQEMLRRMVSITNNKVPVESLLVWDDLYPVIDKLYDNFHKKITSRYGDILIDKEIQLCCLLCAGFSTKEISVVTQQSTPTIYQRKTNIRKKLGMDEKEDIITFISAIQAI